MITTFTVIFYISLSLSAALTLIAAFLGTTPARVLSYISVFTLLVSFLSASYVWRRLEVSLLVLLSFIFYYLILSLVRIALDKRRAGSVEREEDAP